MRYGSGYEWVPAATAVRIHERDPGTVVADGVMAESAHSADAYQDFPVPDDLMW